MPITQQELINTYNLLPHPEGGYYCETYRSKGIIPNTALPSSMSGERNYATAIYFLLTAGSFSAFHRIKQDEVWHYYTGSNLFVHELKPSGAYIRHNVGPTGVFQTVIEAGSWFASEVVDDSGFSFVGCTVAPGFDFRDFELATATTLAAEYTEHRDLITRLCRQ